MCPYYKKYCNDVNELVDVNDYYYIHQASYISELMTNTTKMYRMYTKAVLLKMWSAEHTTTKPQEDA